MQRGAIWIAGALVAAAMIGATVYLIATSGRTTPPATIVAAPPPPPDARVIDPPPAAPAPQLAIVVRDGATIDDVAAELDRVGLAPGDRARAAARDPALVRDAGLPADAPSVEGYLLPGRYTFAAGTPVDRIYRAMIDQQRLRYQVLSTDHGMTLVPVMQRLGWSEREIVILASIVEQETPRPDDARRVAGVLVARLLAKRDPRRLEKIVAPSGAWTKYR